MIKMYASKQQDGWYLASSENSIPGGIVTEAEIYSALRQRVREAVDFCMRNGYHKKLGLPRHPKVQLVYSRILFDNPGAEEVLIAGSNGQGYRAVNDTYSIDVAHEKVEELEKLLRSQVQQRGHDTKHVKLKLEEVL